LWLQGITEWMIDNDMAATNEIFDFSKRLDFGNSAADFVAKNCR